MWQFDQIPNIIPWHLHAHSWHVFHSWAANTKLLQYSSYVSILTHHFRQIPLYPKIDSTKGSNRLLQLVFIPIDTHAHRSIVFNCNVAPRMCRVGKHEQTLEQTPTWTFLSKGDPHTLGVWLIKSQHAMWWNNLHSNTLSQNWPRIHRITWPTHVPRTEAISRGHHAKLDFTLDSLTSNQGLRVDGRERAGEKV